jgi:carotenoid cleavage dioxygenase-like enzyme
MVFELDPPQPQHTNTRSPSSPNTGRCISRKRLDTHTMEFPSVNWDWHGQQHSHIYACADTVGDDLHWGPTQSVLKISCDTAPVQVSWVLRVHWEAGDITALVHLWSACMCSHQASIQCRCGHE